MTNPKNDEPKDRGRLNWTHISTVISAGVLIGTEVFGAAYAAGWALGELLDLDYYLGPYGTYLLQVIFCIGGVYLWRVSFASHSALSLSTDMNRTACSATYENRIS